MKKIISTIALGAGMLMVTSCSDFLDTAPKDALSPSTTWKTPDDAQKFAVGCYNGWESGDRLLYWDCASDFAYNNFPWEGLKDIGNGSLSPSNPGWSIYNFSTIRRCNTFLDKVTAIEFSDEAVKKDLIAQIRAIRAYKYFLMNWEYGGVPIIEDYTSADEAKVPRKSEQEVRDFIEKELDAAIADLKLTNQKGRFTKGAALALRMREALYYEDWKKAKECAQEIISLNQYELEPDYATLFQLSGQDSKEIILSLQYLSNTYGLGVIGQMYNNGDGGWSFIVPTKNLADMYEMKDGKTIDDPTSGYDPAHPFKDRDPRLTASILYPGQDYINGSGKKVVFNSLDKEINGKPNSNYMTAANNCSKTGLTWNKYLAPITQYADIWDTGACPILFRYAEVLLSWAEAENELNGPSAEVYAKLNQVRKRAGMPEVNDGKYNTKESLRELIHRERAVELAGEGLRRADILRWKSADGKMLAEKVLNGRLERFVGTVDMAGANPELRATINLQSSEEDRLIEKRTFNAFNRYLPIPQGNIDTNPKLEQNKGYN